MTQVLFGSGSECALAVMPLAEAAGGSPAAVAVTISGSTQAAATAMAENRAGCLLTGMVACRPSELAC